MTKKQHAETISKLELTERKLLKNKEENKNFSVMVDSLRYEMEAIKTEYTNAQENIDTLKKGFDSLNQQSQGLEEAVMLPDIKPIVIYENTVIQQTDTVLKTVREINGGNIGFYCPTEMYFDEPYDAYGLIADALSREDIKSMVKKSVLQHAQNADATNFEVDDFLIKPVDYYDKIELGLENINPEAFEIKKIHSKDIRKKMKTIKIGIGKSFQNPHKQTNNFSLKL